MKIIEPDVGLHDASIILSFVHSFTCSSLALVFFLAADKSEQTRSNVQNSEGNQLYKSGGLAYVG